MWEAVKFVFRFYVFSDLIELVKKKITNRHTRVVYTFYKFAWLVSIIFNIICSIKVLLFRFIHKYPWAKNVHGNSNLKCREFLSVIQRPYTYICLGTYYDTHISIYTTRAPLRFINFHLSFCRDFHAH